MSEFKGKVIIVTGGGQGIGFAIVKRFAEAGATVIATGRTLSKLENTRNRLKEYDVIPYPMDCGMEQDWIKLVKMIKEQYGALDILVNNAGIETGKDIKTMTFKEFQIMESCNIDSVFLGMKHCYEILKKNQDANIVNISSVASKRSGPSCGNDAGYSASKAAVNLLTKHAAFTFAPDHIRVNAVLPGGVKTPLVEESLKNVEGVEQYLAELNPLPPHLAQPQEIADIVFFVASQGASFMTGSEIVADGGMLTH